MKLRIVLSVLAVALLCVASAFAQRPARNISPLVKPNLAAAQKLIVQAFDKISAAQVGNEFDLGGHAQKAKELLDQASDELKLAAQYANEKKR